MPRYGDSGYDPNFDDSPPPSPRAPTARTPTWRIWWWRARRNKGLIATVLAVLLAWRWVATRTRPLMTPKHAPALRYKNVDWRQFAYSTVATDSASLCSAVMLFDTLDRLDSRAGKVLMFPRHMDADIADGWDRDSQLLVLARDKYAAKLVPVDVAGVRATWPAGGGEDEEDDDDRDRIDTSVMKFLAFNQTQYLRLLHLDGDATVTRNMDDLFLLPSARVAMPRAYWDSTQLLSPHLLLIEPKPAEARRLLDAVAAYAPSSLDGRADAHILSAQYAASAMVLPHRVYGLRTREFAAPDHAAYHGNAYETFHPDRAMAEAALVRFDDPGLPKPWVMWPPEALEKAMPPCDAAQPAPGCRSKEVWMDLYHQFRKRRKDVCGLLSEPAPASKPKAPEKDSEV